MKGIELIGDEIWSIVCGMRGSAIVVKGCGVEMGRGKEAGVFELGGCRGVFWNITLRGRGGWGRRGVREKVGEEEEPDGEEEVEEVKKERGEDNEEVEEEEVEKEEEKEEKKEVKEEGVYW
ncbi:uncharacterized protein MONOS_18062 [Monocercomonoides exilis]|uniref:uncharacterized protein n=1 Tax=Monocercomonoides exilis TaxID=2049356 RepID=UPI003559459B|nr:hypothetical protein MONOS_18062 [Monocercomonoides exilis]